MSYEILIIFIAKKVVCSTNINDKWSLSSVERNFFLAISRSVHLSALISLKYENKL